MRKRIMNVLVVLAVVLLQGCSDSRLPPLADDAVILAFGDSLTVGVGSTEDNSYPAVLGRLSGRQVVSAGVSGEVSAQGRQRLSQVLAQVKPDLLVLLHGGNDILRNRSAAELQDNLEAMIKMAHDVDVPVVLLGVPEKKLFSDAAPLYFELAERHDLVFIEDLLSGLLRDSSMKSDAVHLNAQGYRALARGIHARLQAEGAL
ncbi:GDSL-type esterase/lipase family protein [Marinobacterium weihaiense]|uniref:Arylesterase n=1 Tax=Marinobacterium weihaiense TaxID=2851016 RepID=A0ABS6MBQ8_9GAMM|nr:GDSL-type esterase/lipase family protein [Marinobacterium weihaiense]MBV0933710.1 arylesterase [Marinobacterium weihaiense]